MSGQLTLLPTDAPELRRERLPLEAIDEFADASPSPKLRELIRDLGLLQPIVVVASRSGRFRVVEGRRRCKAIAELAEAGEWSIPAHVDALVIDGRQASRREVRGGLALALHGSRSSSPASELAAIEAILETGGTGGAGPGRQGDRRPDDADRAQAPAAQVADRSYRTCWIDQERKKRSLNVVRAGFR